MLARLLFLLPLWFALPAWAQQAPLEVNVKRVDADGHNQFQVAASGTVQAAPAVVWKILTNYERHPEFVPDLLSAKVISRNGNKVVLEQLGQARFLFFKREIHLVINIVEEPMNLIDIDLVDGDMKQYQCRWELTPLADGGTRISYGGKLVPKFYVPGLLGANLIRSDIERMMAAVLARIDQPG